MVLKSSRNPRHLAREVARSHSSCILSFDLIGLHQNKRFYVTEIVLPLGFADAIFRRERSDDRKCVCCSQANAVWKERGLPKITERRLCDQARAIRKNEWFTSIELDEARRRMTTVDEELEEQDAGCIDSEPEQVNELIGDVNVQITDNDTRNNEERQMIKDILEIMRSGQVWNGAGFKRVDRTVLAEWMKKVITVVSQIQTTNITDTNKFINANN